MVPVREGRKLWWYSSPSATQATSAKAASHQSRLSLSLCDVRKARAASSASTAYSEKCAALRTRKWTSASDASEISGKSQSSSGLMMREVFDAEKFDDEAKSTKHAHATSGP